MMKLESNTALMERVKNFTYVEAAFIVAIEFNMLLFQC